MPIEPRAQIKTYFETGDQPTQTQFEILLDSYVHKDEDTANFLIETIKTEALNGSSNIIWNVDTNSAKPLVKVEASAEISLPNHNVTAATSGEVIRVNTSGNAVNLNFEDASASANDKNFWYVWHFRANFNMNLVFPNGQFVSTAVDDQTTGDTLTNTQEGAFYLVIADKVSGEYQIACRILPAAPGSGATQLNELSDVDLSGLTTNQILQYNGTNFVPVNMPSGGGGATAINDLTDVDTSGLSVGEILEWDGTNFVPVAKPVSGATAINQLSDVDTSGLSTGQILEWDGTNFVPGNKGTGGGATAINDLTDVDTSGLSVNDILQWDGTNFVPIPTPSGGGATAINDLSDVDTSGLSTNDILQWNGTNFVPIALPVSGATAINDLSDVDTSGLATNDILQWDGTNFVPVPMPSGGTVNLLDDIGNVDTTGKADGSIVVWNNTASEWQNEELVDVLDSSALTAADETALKDDANYDANGIYDNNPAISINPDYLVYDPQDVPYTYRCVNGVWSRLSRVDTTGGGGATAINDLTDVDTSGLSVGEILEWDGTNFVPGAKGAGGFPPLDGSTAYANIFSSQSINIQVDSNEAYFRVVRPMLDVTSLATIALNTGLSGAMYGKESGGGNTIADITPANVVSGSYWYINIVSLGAGEKVILRVNTTDSNKIETSGPFAFDESIVVDGSGFETIEIETPGLYTVIWESSVLKRLSFVPYGSSGSSVFGSEFHQVQNQAVQRTNLIPCNQACF